MPVLEFRINGNLHEILRFKVKKKMINAGYTGRNQEEVQKHIDELKEKGISAPDETPTYFPVFNDRIVQDETVEVLDETDHSGEAEYVLLCTEEEIYVAVGSDHTDRKLEEDSIPKAKQIYPNKQCGPGDVASNVLLFQYFSHNQKSSFNVLPGDTGDILVGDESDFIAVGVCYNIAFTKSCREFFSAHTGRMSRFGPFAAVMAVSSLALIPAGPGFVLLLLCAARLKHPGYCRLLGRQQGCGKWLARAFQEPVPDPASGVLLSLSKEAR